MTVLSSGISSVFLFSHNNGVNLFCNCLRICPQEVQVNEDVQLPYLSKGSALVFSSGVLSKHYCFSETLL